MKDHNQTVDSIPEHAKGFIKVAQEKCRKDLDFSTSSIAMLDEIVLSWQSMSREEMLAVFDDMCFYLGEVIRRNLGGCWTDPKWKNPDNSEAKCYLTKVGGVLTVVPSKWVKRRFIEGQNETFKSYYKSIKQKAKAINRDLRKERLSRPVGSGALGIDKSTSIITLLQFLGVLLGWMLCRGAILIGGIPYSGLPLFLVKHGYTLSLIPMIWAPLMIYKNGTNRIPVLIDKAIGVFGYIAIFGDCANATGDNLSILAVLADILSKQDSFGRIWLWMVPDIMNLTAPKG